MGAALPAVLTAGATVFGANAAGQAGQNIATQNQAMTQKQIDEMQRQFNITNPQSVAEFNTTQETGNKQFGAGLGSTEAQFNAQQEAQRQALQQATETGNAQMANQGGQFNASLGSNQAQFNAGLGGQDILKTAYQQGIKNIGGMTTGAEKQLNTIEGQAAPEVQQLQKDIANKATKSMQDTAAQTGANLQAQGVRGGQAATLQNRAVGEVGLQAQRDINQVAASDAQARQALLAGYQAQKAGLGNQFATSETTAGMTDVEGNKTYGSLADKTAGADITKAADKTSAPTAISTAYDQAINPVKVGESPNSGSNAYSAGTGSGDATQQQVNDVVNKTTEEDLSNVAKKYTGMTLTNVNRMIADGKARGMSTADIMKQIQATYPI